MAEGKHTPGPWGCHWDYKPMGDGLRVKAFAIGPEHVCNGVPLGDSHFLQPDRATMEKVIAEAYIVAAAPDLLAELRAIIEVCEAAIALLPENITTTRINLIHRVGQARAAIAKAKGET